MECESAEAAAVKIVELVKEKLPGYYHIKPETIQVLTPMQRGPAGAAGLNPALQEALNPSGMGGAGAVMFSAAVIKLCRLKTTMTRKCLTAISA